MLDANRLYSGKVRFQNESSMFFDDAIQGKASGASFPAD